MSSYQHETLDTLHDRTWRVSALSSALRELILKRAVEDEGPVLGVLEALESEAGEINEIIAAMVGGGSTLEVTV